MNTRADDLERTRQFPAHLNGDSPIAANGDALEWAILQSCAYADVFDYPLTLSEIHRYLVGIQASVKAISARLTSAARLHRELKARHDFWTLVGREHLVEVRRQRSLQSRQLWPLARRYGRQIARLPFVRLVAVTGALAVDNLGDRPDIDYLVVTEPGRLWLCRSLVIALVRLAARQGVTLCPNYFLSTKALYFPNGSLYTAHELVQMSPLSGLEVYARMRAQNQWTLQYLPNAISSPSPGFSVQSPSPPSLWKRLGENLIRTPPGGWLEVWEMKRKVRRFKGKSAGEGEAEFCADWCKGHFDGHARHTLQEFQLRLDVLGVPLEYRLV
ncbi:MAG TPA: hypothetical protein VJ436_08320 [Anaerolineales bacterium]|nr:hypothetical protein [Anaerolineales bacterium]